MPLYAYYKLKGIDFYQSLKKNENISEPYDLEIGFKQEK